MTCVEDHQKVTLLDAKLAVSKCILAAPCCRLLSPPPPSTTTLSASSPLPHQVTSPGEIPEDSSAESAREVSERGGFTVAPSAIITCMPFVPKTPPSTASEQTDIRGGISLRRFWERRPGWRRRLLLIFSVV